MTSVVAYAVSFGIYLLPALVVVAFENSTRYGTAALITAVAVVVLVCILVAPSHRSIRPAELWAAGHEIDLSVALAGTYTYSRRLVRRGVWGTALWAGALLVAVGMMVGATPGRLVQYAVIGASVGAAVQLIALRSIAESILRPVRSALTADAAIGDTLPRSHPTFATWSNVAMVAASFGYAALGALVAAALAETGQTPVLCLVIASATTLLYAVPISVGIGFSPSLEPVRDLTEGAERVAAGDFSRRLPVVQDDDLGALAASFNRMQAGLAERQRLQAAFGTYVDPGLAARLLEQGDDVFSGERREVTVIFVDIRDFTPFAEANSAEDTVAQLNALFEIVVPAVVDAGGHVNKFLGDGALAVFGAPNHLAGHADAAVTAATAIQRAVVERFGGKLRIGIGINTGTVIAGTIGAAGKLEFTLIGDAVNIAARVEQLTKTTGDAILLTQDTVDAMTSPPGLVDRGSHTVKGKSAAVPLFSIAAGPEWPVIARKTPLSER